MPAFISGGGTPVWKFLEFEHNTDQTSTSKKIGKRFRLPNFPDQENKMERKSN